MKIKPINQTSRCWSPYSLLWDTLRPLSNVVTPRKCLLRLSKFFLLLGVVLICSPPLVQAQQPPGSIVRPFYIGFEGNRSQGIGCGQSLFLGNNPTDNNRLVAFRFLVEYGDYTKEQAAGIVGNLEAESGVDPHINQRGGPGRGIAQWEASDAGGSGRWDTLLEFAKILGLNERDLGTQLSFIIYELQGRSKLGSRGGLNGAGGWGHGELVGTTTVEAAAEVFVRRFEIPAFIINQDDPTPEAAATARAAGISHRQDLAQDVFEAFKDIAITARNLEADIGCASLSCPAKGERAEDAIPEDSGELTWVSNGVGGSVRVHKCVENNARRLLQDINSQFPGDNISGGGYRTELSQIISRLDSCANKDYETLRNTMSHEEILETYNDEIFVVRSSDCDPHVARPGTSRHQQGLAIDFKVGGATICYSKPRAICRDDDPLSHKNVFNWLTSHAAEYGFKKLSSEAWHWSIDGR